LAGSLIVQPAATIHHICDTAITGVLETGQSMQPTMAANGRTRLCECRHLRAERHLRPQLLRRYTLRIGSAATPGPVPAAPVGSNATTRRWRRLKHRRHRVNRQQ